MVAPENLTLDLFEKKKREKAGGNIKIRVLDYGRKKPFSGTLGRRKKEEES